MRIDGFTMYEDQLASVNKLLEFSNFNSHLIM